MVNCDGCLIASEDQSQNKLQFSLTLFVFNFLRKREEEAVGAASPKRLAPPAPQLQLKHATCAKEEGEEEAEAEIPKQVEG